MSKIRYVVNLEAYIYAENDKDAKFLADQMARRITGMYDNNAQVTELICQPKGTFESREVKL